MSWYNQGSAAKWLIAVLLVMNIITLIIIWMLVGRNGYSHTFNKDRRPPNPLMMLQKELNLTEEQTRQFEGLREKHFRITDSLMNQLNLNRKLIVNELFNPETSREAIILLADKISESEKNLELARFDHFSDVIMICTPDQREKLKDILIKMILRKPPPHRGDAGPQKIR